MSLKDAGQIETVIRRNVGSPGQPAFRVLAVGSAHADICLPYDEGMTRLGDTISGPVLMTAADAAMYAAIIAHVPDGEYAVTSHFHIDFLRRPRPDGQWVAHGHSIVDTPEVRDGRDRGFERREEVLRFRVSTALAERRVSHTIHSSHIQSC